MKTAKIVTNMAKKFYGFDKTESVKKWVLVKYIKKVKVLNLFPMDKEEEMFMAQVVPKRR